MVDISELYKLISQGNTIEPIKRILDRARRHGDDSDAVLFSELLLCGELITKLSVLALVSTMDRTIDFNPYNILHSLVRADGIGEWAENFNKMLKKPATESFVPDMLPIVNIYSQKCSSGDWRFEATKLLHGVLKEICPETESLSTKISLKNWFVIFSQLRNKTRGHGATTPAVAARLASNLKQSIELLAYNSPVFHLPWAYLHRNLSGRYRVNLIGNDCEFFQNIKTSSGVFEDNLQDGVYLFCGNIREVRLLLSDSDISDFFVPNGNFNGKTFEVISFISDERNREDASFYLTPSGNRPVSETEGRTELDFVGDTLTNMPSEPVNYIARPKLQDEIFEILINDRHPIVTLVGRGGIGKTSVALKVLYDIAKSGNFEAIIWFSARDIDLTMNGAKQVRAKILTERDIAKEYTSLIGQGSKNTDDQETPISRMEQDLRKSPFNRTLFIFDNFETVKNPVDLFNWLDHHVRLPNKILITSRFRAFKADYPIEVHGMEVLEAQELVKNTVSVLKIENLINEEQKTELIDELDGHPYVIKIFLGEVANNKKYAKPARIVARQDDILEALFERTFKSLPPLERRIFLTLSLWRSLVPQFAVEGVLLRHKGEQINPEAAIDNLVRSSLVERHIADDESDFLEVPLTAALFGQKKAETSPIRPTIEADLSFLQDMGTTAESGIHHGISHKIERFFRKIAYRVELGQVSLGSIRDTLRYFANKSPHTWLLLARIEEEQGGQDSLNNAIECINKFLELNPDPKKAYEAWSMLKRLYQLTDNTIGSCNAFLRTMRYKEPSISDLSHMSNLINQSDEIKSLPIEEKKSFYEPLIFLMNSHIQELSPTQLSRLAWMYIHIGEKRSAWTVGQEGLKIDPTNIYCRRLVDRFSSNQ